MGFLHLLLFVLTLTVVIRSFPVTGDTVHLSLQAKETMPVIVRDMDDDAAIILMVDANLQRETILPSERAFAYKMKLDAIKQRRVGGRI